MSERKPYQSDLTDEQWALIEPVLTAWKNRHRSVSGHEGRYSMREIVKGILPAVVGQVVRADTDYPRVAAEAHDDGRDVGPSFRCDGGGAGGLRAPGARSRSR